MNRYERGWWMVISHNAPVINPNSKYKGGPPHAGI
jgi:hypothetical protein